MVLGVREVRFKESSVTGIEGESRTTQSVRTRAEKTQQVMEGRKRSLDRFPIVNEEEKTKEQENRSVEKEAATVAHENVKEKMVRYEFTSENEGEGSEENANRMLEGVMRV